MVAPASAVGCIINELGCETSITRRMPGIDLQPGQTSAPDPRTTPSRLGTSRDNLTVLLGKIADGSLITGSALVLTVNGTTTTVTFDASGQPIATCTTGTTPTTDCPNI